MLTAERTQTVTVTRVPDTRQWVAPRPLPAAAVAAPSAAVKAPRPHGKPARRVVRTTRRKSRLARAVQALTWRSPMTAAVLLGTFLVTLLCGYVAAYARVTATGFELSVLRRDLRRTELEEEALRAELSRLKQPEAVARRAQAMGMVVAPPESARVLPADAPAQAVAQNNP